MKEEKFNLWQRTQVGGDQGGSLAKRGKRGRKEELNPGRNRIKVLSGGWCVRKVVDVGGKQTLLVDVKINCFPKQQRSEPK